MHDLEVHALPYVTCKLGTLHSRVQIWLTAMQHVTPVYTSRPDLLSSPANVQALPAELLLGYCAHADACQYTSP